MNAKHFGRYVAYYRVSTARQGRSGLGLEAQRQALGEHLNGGNWKLVGEYTEVESGKRSDRPNGVSPSRRQADYRQAGPSGPQRRLHLQLDGVEGRIWISRKRTVSRYTSWRPSPSTKLR
jgi:hypothetical protein